MNTIECPKCHHLIPIDQALAEQAKNEIDKEMEEKYKKEMVAYMEEIKTLKTKRFDTEIEIKKRVLADQDKIMAGAKKKAEEESQLILAQKDKRKGQQGSQQTQGEVLELELEKVLKAAFPGDNIQPVPKGVRGADLIQEVINKNGIFCGIILWESKNAQWSQAWIEKLKNDQRDIKASISV